MMEDMFSSAKGAGIIGMVLGLIVFAAFIGLGVAVFDGRFSGDDTQSIDSKLAQQEAEMVFLNGRTKELEKNLETERKNSSLRTKTDVIADRLSGLADTQIEISSKLGEMKKAIEGVQSARNTYRQSYRDAVRAKAVGTEIDELKTLDGRVFKSVKIRKVTALELNFMDQTGPKGVSYKDLPLEMQDYYQFDEKEATGVRSERDGTRQKVSDRLQKVDDQERAKKKAWNEKTKTEERLKAEQQIAALESKINDAQVRIQQERSKASYARQQHELARARGNMSAHLVTAKKADEAAARLQKAIEEANRMIQIQRRKIQQ